MADETATAPKTDYAQVSQWVSNLGEMLFNQFHEYERNRVMIEQRWIEDLERYRGQYTTAQKAAINPKRSSVFVRQTRLKVEIFTRLMLQVALGNTDQTWTLEPDPNPVMPVQDQQLIIKALDEKLNPPPQPGQPPQPHVTPTRLQIETAIRELANIRARNMERTILSQLDGDSRKQWTNILRKAIRAGNTFGIGIVKGPLVTESQGTKYKPVESTDPATGQPTMTWEAEAEQKYAPYVTHCAHWGFYPDPAAMEPEDLQGAFERHIKTRVDMVSMSKREDFDGEKILELINAYPEGTAMNWKSFETQLRAIGEEENSFTRQEREKRYEVLEFWGLVPAEKLREAGCPDVPEDATGDMWAQVWLMGPVVIKCVLTHLQDRKMPYYFYYFDKDESSFWGQGIPALTKDPQDILNSSTRVMLDNAAICAGPQMDVNMDLLESPNDEDILDVVPFKAWARTGQGQEAMAPAVRAITFDSHIQEVNLIRQMGEQLMDDISGVPRVDQGDEQVGQAAQTASGLSMLMSRSNSMVREQLLRYDDEVTRPMVSELVCWNMEFNDDPDIKGSFSVKARGVAGVQAREVRNQQLLQFWQVVSQDPQLRSMVNINELLRQVAMGFEVPESVVYEEEEAKQNQEVMQSQQSQAVLSQVSPVIQKLTAELQKLQNQVNTLEKGNAVQPDPQAELELRKQKILGDQDIQRTKVAGELGIKQAGLVAQLRDKRSKTTDLSPAIGGQGDGGFAA
jgi:hypothetical protein